MNTIRQDVRNALIAVQQATAAYRAAVKARELAQQTLDAEQKKYALGASTIFFVIQYQRDLATAKATEVQAQSQYAKAKVQMDVATGDTLDRYNIALDEAVKGLRQAGTQDHLPRGLLARAELHRIRRDFDHARRDLDEAMTIATRGGMRLHQADCRLECARLHLAMGDKAKALESFTTARAMITEMGYHRRDPEVAALETQLASTP